MAPRRRLGVPMSGKDSAGWGTQTSLHDMARCTGRPHEPRFSVGPRQTPVQQMLWNVVVAILDDEGLTIRLERSLLSVKRHIDVT